MTSTSATSLVTFLNLSGLQFPILWIEMTKSYTSLSSCKDSISQYLKTFRLECQMWHHHPRDVSHCYYYSHCLCKCCTTTNLLMTAPFVGYKTTFPLLLYMRKWGSVSMWETLTANSVRPDYENPEFFFHVFVIDSSTGNTNQVFTLI